MDKEIVKPLKNNIRTVVCPSLNEENIPFAHSNEITINGMEGMQYMHGMEAEWRQNAELLIVAYLKCQEKYGNNVP